MSALSQIQEGEIPSRLDEEQQAIRIGISTREIGLVQQSLQGAMMNMKIIDDIQELKEQLLGKDLELDKLRAKVKYLEDKNNDLCIKLEAKDSEVKDLKERIRTLEDEKKSLEQKLASVQYKLKTVEDDVKKLTTSRESDEEKYTKLEEKFKKMQYTLDNVVEDLQTTKDENKKLNLEIKQVRHQSRYVRGAPPLMPVPESEGTKALANLGEMCLQIQAGFYKKILPSFFTPIRSYTIATLKKDIDKLCETDAEKTQALKRWEDLKATLQLNEEDFEEALNVLQDIYNRSLDTKTPSLSVKVLKESAESLERKKILKGWISLERVNGLIDIWENLVDCGEKA